MANILTRYGIKEVADVTFYDLVETNGVATRGAPVLFLDTLKVSTIEQTGEQAEARGGKGNPPLLIWDYGKEINVTLEDALFSAKSMAIMFGDGKVSTTKPTILKTWAGPFTGVPEGTLKYGNKEIHYTKLTTPKFYDEEGNEIKTTDLSASKPAAFLTGGIPLGDVGVIEISANSFPGTYYITGDTYARSELTGKDEFFQFIIEKAKVQSENTITLEAEGDPSIFNMSLRVLRPASGEMMKLVKYDLAVDADKAKTTGT